MTIQERFEQALQSPEPAAALRSVVLDLGHQGHTRKELYELLEQVLARLRERKDFLESEEDAVLDVMDALTGWCHPSAELLQDD